jgi:hypothetical protein
MAAPAVNSRILGLVSVVASVTTWAAAAHGQTSGNPAPFSRITVRAGALWPKTDSRLAQFYRPSTGYSAELSSPFDVGEFALALERATFTGLAPHPHPAFHGTVGMLKWRMPLPRLGPLSIAIGAHAGAMRFSFQDTVIAAGLRKEMEVLFGANAMGNVRLPANFSAFAMGEYTHVRLHVPVHLAPVSAGLGYSLTTPGWLRDFLQ